MPDCHSPAGVERPALGVARRGLHADHRALVQLLERCRAGVGAGRAHAGGDRVDEVLDARTGRVEVLPSGRDALLEQRLAGAVERALADSCGWRPRAPTPCRSCPCTCGRRRRCAGRPATRSVPANHEPIITADAPAASASATSRGCRTPPSAQTCLPSSRAAAAHSSTAENCGRPTPVIIRVVHMAPGPTPTLTMSAPASMRSRVPVGRHDVAGDDRHGRRRARGRPRSASSIRCWWPCAVSTTSTSTPGLEQVAPPCRRRRR